jgi:hypothetical protein
MGAALFRQAKRFRLYPIALLFLFLCGIVVPSYAVAQAIDVGLEEELVRLEFPAEGDWAPTNGSGVLKWTRPFTYAIRSEAPKEGDALKRDLSGMLGQLPLDARLLAFEGSVDTVQPEAGAVDVLIWTTRTPWSDCRGVLRPFIDKLNAGMDDVDAAISRAEAHGTNAFVKFAFDRHGSLIGAILVVDAQRVSGSRLLNLTRRFMLSSMSPRLFAIEDDWALIARAADGQLSLALPILRLFAVIYDPKTRSGATESQFRDAIRGLIERVRSNGEIEAP